MSATATCLVCPTARRPLRGGCRRAGGVLWGVWGLWLMLLCLPVSGFAREGDAGSSSGLERFRQAARQGDAVAQTNLGALYLHGVGVRRNLTKAQYWFQRAAEQGEGLAQFNMGVLAQEGQGTLRDDQKAAEWFRRVAAQPARTDQFNPVIKGWAQLKLGFIYYEGRGVARDYQAALQWFKLAAERGIVMAQEMLGQMYAQGLGGPRDEKRSFFWYEQAATQGSRTAEKAVQEFSQKLTLAQRAEARTLESPPQVRAGTEPPSGLPAQLAGQPPKGALLKVVPNPADAQVRILNIRPAYTPGMRLEPGKYHLEVSRKGYRPETVWVTLPDGELKVDVTLMPEGSPAVVATAKPAASASKPEAPVVKPEIPVAKPVASVAKPEVPVAKPVVPVVKPEVPVVKPEVPVAKPVAPVAKPVAPIVKPEAPVAKSDVFDSKPDLKAVPAKPVASAVQSAPSGKPATAVVRRDVPVSVAVERYALTVQAEPAAARVKVMNIVPPYRPGMLLEPGRYRLEVSHPGFETRRLQVTVAQQDLRVPVVLAREEKKPAVAVVDRESESMEACPVAEPPVSARPRQYGLTVQSDPEDAHVQILNIKAPYQPGISLPPGRYRVAIAREAFKTRQCWAEIVDRDLDLAVALTPVAPGDLRALTIKPQPADAVVRVLNIRAPYRPGMLLESGSYRVEVSKKGYRTEQRVVELGSRDVTVPIHLTELPLVARPTLTVVPVLQGVEIRIINADTPYHPGVPLAPGRYLLELSKPGFKTQQRWVELSEQDVKIEIALEENKKP